MHAEVLDTILFHECWNPADVPWFPEMREFRLEGHCCEYIVRATFNPDSDTYTVYDLKVRG